MFPYIILYIVLFLLSFKIKKGKFTFFDYLLVIILILFSALRCVGVDYHLYSLNFENLSEFSTITSRTGIGYAFFAYFVKFVLKGNFQFIIFVISFFTNLFIYLFFKKFSERPGMSALIYVSFGFYTTSFNMFRQTLSLSLILLGALNLHENKYLKTILCYIFAFLIHSSAILPICVYSFLFKFKNFKIDYRFVYLFSIVILLFYDKLFPYFINLFNDYSMYLTYDSTPGIGTYLIVLTHVFIFLFLINRNKSRLIAYRGNSLFFNIMLLGTAIMLLELKNFLFFRIAFYFTVSIAVVLVDYYQVVDLKKNKVLSFLLYICIFVYYLVYINSFDGVMPYISILSL